MNADSTGQPHLLTAGPIKASTDDAKPIKYIPPAASVVLHSPSMVPLNPSVEFSSDPS